MGATNTRAAPPAASRAGNAGTRTQSAPGTGLRPFLGRGLPLPQSRLCTLLDALGGDGAARVPSSVTKSLP